MVALASASLPLNEVEVTRTGQSVRVMRPRRAAPADALRPTRAEVNLANLRFNYRALESHLAKSEGGSHKRPRIWGVLKADAYGHGASAVARTLERAGMSGVCVALLEEAIELRSAGIRIPILVMGGYFGPRRAGIDELLEHNLTPVVYDAAEIERIATVIKYSNREPLRVHLKVDTGMGRLGVSPAELPGVLDAFARHREVQLDGLMTHLACADAPDLETTEEQLRRFAELTSQIKRRGLSPKVIHAANSAATLRMPAAWFDAVRPGIALFGATPQNSQLPELKPVMRVRSEIVALRTIPKGEAIGYGHTWRAERESRIATVPMGYADGLDRLLSNKGHGLVHGKRAPIAGTVSMDLTMLDVTDVPNAKVGDEIVWLGPQEGSLGKDVITADEIAEQTGRISWEVLTSVSRRVPRFYREP
ncbi:MAG: alanine racemase [Polyangiaceae bacterium]|nr:alanine racemase [Polyangiaceae bacterium]